MAIRGGADESFRDGPALSRLVGSEKLGPLSTWLRFKSDIETTPDERDDIRTELLAVYHTALRKNLAESGIVLDENNDIVDIRPDVLDHLDLDRLPPGSEDDPEIARACATIRALKERNASTAPLDQRDGAATYGHAPAQRGRRAEAISPRQLPDVRAALVDHLHAPSTAVWWRKSEAAGETFHRPALQPHLSVDQIRLAERDRLARATLFTLSPEMMDLVLAASASLPECRIHPDNVPAPIGLCYYPTPIAHVEPGDLPLSAISWSTNDAGIFMSWYVSEMVVLDDPAEAGEPRVMSRITPRDGLRYYGETELLWHEGEAFTLRGDGDQALNDVLRPLIAT